MKLFGFLLAYFMLFGIVGIMADTGFGYGIFVAVIVLVIMVIIGSTRRG